MADDEDTTLLRRIRWGAARMARTARIEPTSWNGVSYDDVTHVLSEHTCRGLNTCSGYSCVVTPPDAST